MRSRASTASLGFVDQVLRSRDQVSLLVAGSRAHVGAVGRIVHNHGRCSGAWAILGPYRELGNLAEFHGEAALVPALDDAAESHLELKRLLAGVLGGPELVAVLKLAGAVHLVEVWNQDGVKGRRGGRGRKRGGGKRREVEDYVKDEYVERWMDWNCQ